MSVLVVGASGDYLDPWHPFAETTTELADIARAMGLEVDVRNDVDEAFAEVSAPTDLMIVNFGNAGPGTPSAPARDNIGQFLQTGGSMLGMHSVATAFPDWGDWETLLGGRWVRGTTFHPPRTEGRVDRVGIRAGDAITTFTTTDEFYTGLRVRQDARPLATHRIGGPPQPLAWTRRCGSGATAYIGLGHDRGAYASPGFRDLLTDVIGSLLSSAGGRR